HRREISGMYEVEEAPAHPQALVAVQHAARGRALELDHPFGVENGDDVRGVLDQGAKARLAGAKRDLRTPPIRDVLVRNDDTSAAFPPVCGGMNQEEALTDRGMADGLPHPALTGACQDLTKRRRDGGRVARARSPRLVHHVQIVGTDVVTSRA